MLGGEGDQGLFGLAPSRETGDHVVGQLELDRLGRGDYFAILAYLSHCERYEAELQAMRSRVMVERRVATCVELTDDIISVAEAAGRSTLAHSAFESASHFLAQVAEEERVHRAL